MGVVMSERYAIIDSENRAVNFVLYDGVSAYDPGEGLSLVKMPDGISYDYGWVWDGEKFINPDPNPAEG